VSRMKEEYERRMSAAEVAGRTFYEAVEAVRKNRPDMLDNMHVMKLSAGDPRAAVELMIGRAYLDLLKENEQMTARIKDLESAGNRGEQE